MRFLKVSLPLQGVFQEETMGTKVQGSGDSRCRDLAGVGKMRGTWDWGSGQTRAQSCLQGRRGGWESGFLWWSLQGKRDLGICDTTFPGPQSPGIPPCMLHMHIHGCHLNDWTLTGLSAEKQN